jgi:hypothetical protein
MYTSYMIRKRKGFLAPQTEVNSKEEKSKLSVYQIIGLFILSNLFVICVLLLIYLLF